MTLSLRPLLSFFPLIVAFLPNIDFKPENPDPVVPDPPVTVEVTFAEDPLARGVGLGEKSDVPDGVDDSRLSILRDAKR